MWDLYEAIERFDKIPENIPLQERICRRQKELNAMREALGIRPKMNVIKGKGTLARSTFDLREYNKSITIKK